MGCDLLLRAIEGCVVCETDGWVLVINKIVWVLSVLGSEFCVWCVVCGCFMC